MTEKPIDPNKPQATKQDVAKHFGVTTRAIDKWMADTENPLPHYKRGHSVRFKLAEVEAHFKQQKAASN